MNSGTGSQIEPNNVAAQNIAIAGRSAPAGLICSKVAFGSGTARHRRSPGPRKITSEIDDAGAQGRGEGDSPD